MCVVLHFGKSFIVDAPTVPYQANYRFWYCQSTFEYTNLKGAFCPNTCIQMCLLRQKYSGVIVEGLTMENTLLSFY